MILHMATPAADVVIREARPEDVPEMARICFEAFGKINADHNFPPEMPELAPVEGLLTMMVSHPGVYTVVAEADGKVIGSNCMDERSPIFGIGPITVDPNSQNRGTGRQLMQAVLDRTEEKGAPGVRLVQAAFHNRSLCLYTTLGFNTVEPLSVFQGPAIKKQVEGRTVRKAEMDDLAECAELCERLHGYHRSGELADAIEHQGTASVAEHDGRITAYTTNLAFFGHSVAESNTDLQALIADADAFGGAGILVPTRNAELFRWLLSEGLRVVEPMTLMAKGDYREPKGAYLPSILY